MENTPFDLKAYILKYRGLVITLVVIFIIDAVVLLSALFLGNGNVPSPSTKTKYRPVLTDKQKEILGSTVDKSAGVMILSNRQKIKLSETVDKGASLAPLTESAKANLLKAIEF